MAFKTRGWGAGKRVLIGGALVVTYLLFAGAAMRLALKTRDAVVPPLAGKTVNEATAILGAAGLNLKVEEARRVDGSVPAGRIINQEPEAGVMTRRERSVKVWVSAGTRASAVPALLGESERTATLRAQHNPERLSKSLALAQGGQVALADDGYALVTSGTKRYQGYVRDTCKNRSQRG